MSTTPLYLRAQSCILKVYEVVCFRNLLVTVVCAGTSGFTLRQSCKNVTLSSGCVSTDYSSLLTSSASFLCLSTCSCLPQEGQLLECSLINSIRVGAVPKVRPLERRLLSQHSHFQLPPQAPPRVTSGTLF